MQSKWKRKLRMEESVIPPTYIKAHKRKGYHLFGKNLATYKPCHYWKKAISDRVFCYKYWFYGIPPSHRCIQWSPMIDCNEACQFCWRVHRTDVGLPPFRKKQLQRIDWPEPEKLMRDLTGIFRNTLRGFHPEHREKTEDDLWEDAMQNPPHLAISLTGEPLMYPYLGEVIRIAKERGMSSFVVTNGTFPKKMETLDTLPTQIYITVAGSEYDTWAELTNPVWNPRSQWEKLNESLNLLTSLNTRTVIRITAVKGVNMDPEGYARLITTSEPNFVSIKGFSHIGGARKRLRKENQPSMDELGQFAENLAEKTGYKIEEKVKRGRAILLGDTEEERIITEREYSNVKR